MNQRIDCEVFQDQLDALSEAQLPDEGMEQLRLHAASCPQCAMQLRVHEHLAARSPRDLEAAVPDELAGSVWPRVRAEIATHESARESERSRRHGWSWLVPALAAATVLLIVGSGLLYREVKQLHERETALVHQIGEQQRRLAELDLRTSMDPAARAASLAGRTVWERALSRRKSVSVAELEAMLHSVPERATVFSAAEMEALSESIPFWTATAVGAALSEIRSDDGIQAGELLRLVATLDIEPGRRIPTARILAISGGAARLGRS
ncbi:MAG: hypothetical protein GTN62_15285 [Gemmatimonadales bacterium]|nr:hypothetical protein [Gemmatimonadales bacterium]NIN13175.1 hypothetical protein [Gemmatimonadales bacterium]NIN51453.1 hypothetical protein [Gemmatimonadales bacterium]NIP08917.1 hypothetical protein [Gemmatimonadales bacterium]NIR03705.1 hypothetical protein [Gemmatimonadales bacterium]